MAKLSEYLERTNTKFISIDPSDKRRIIIESKYGKHSINKYSGLNVNSVTIESAIDKDLFFKNRAIEVHGNRYDYSNVKYVNSSSNVEIICKIHGSFIQSAAHHLEGRNCPRCNNENIPNSNSDFITRVKLKLPNIEVIGEYVSMTKRILVKDENNIEYLVPAKNLLKGVAPTIRLAVNKNLAFEFKARLVHGDAYCYSDVNYNTSMKNIDIICKTHGRFNQCASDHLRGRGCPECGRERNSNNLKINPLGWNLSNWIKCANISAHFDSYKVYIINCYDENEHFIKIGRTFNTLYKRFHDKNKFPYDYDVIKLIEGDAYHIFKLESKLKRICKKHRYNCLKKFCGMYECFTLDALEILKENKYVNT